MQIKNSFYYGSPQKLILSPNNGITSPSNNLFKSNSPQAYNPETKWKNKYIDLEKKLESYKILEIHNKKCETALFEYEKKLDFLLKENNEMNIILGEILKNFVKGRKKENISKKVLQLIEHNSKLNDLLNNSENVLIETEKNFQKENSQKNFNETVKINNLSKKVVLLIEENEKMTKILEFKFKEEEENNKQKEKLEIEVIESGKLANNLDRKIKFLMEENEKLLIFSEEGLELKKELNRKDNIMNELIEKNSNLMHELNDLSKEKRKVNIHFEGKIIELCKENEMLRNIIEELNERFLFFYQKRV